MPRDIIRQMSAIDCMGKATRVCSPRFGKVPGTAHIRMKVIGEKTTIKTSATSEIGRLTKSLKKMKMNNLTFWQFSISKCGDAF